MADSHRAVAPCCSNTPSPLELKGAGVRDYNLFIFSVDVYAVYLYGPPEISLARLRGARRGPVAAVIDILRGDLPDKMPGELRRLLEPTLTAQELSAVKAAYSRLGKGDCVTVVHAPNDGTKLSINGNLVVHSRDRALMDNMLDNWLGPQAVSTRLRSSLMSGSVPAALDRADHARVCRDEQVVER